MQNNPNISNGSLGETAPQEREPVVRLEDLSHLIRSKRWAERLTLEEVSKKIGVSAATLSRWERGGMQASVTRGQDNNRKSMREPDTRTLAALTHWLGVSIDRMVDVQPTPHDTQKAVLDTVDTLDIVEAHLRADRNLDAQSAELLARLFRVAYEQFSGTGAGGSRVEENSQEPPLQTKHEVENNAEDRQDTKRGRTLKEEEHESRG